MLESIDDGVGLITDKLKALGLDENTIVIFSSDNGGESNVTSNAPLRGGKSQLYEGGIRVPLIVSWPEQIPAGSVSHQPTANVDHYPTLLAAANAQTDQQQKLDGTSLLRIWQKPGTALKRDPLYWHYPLEKPHFLGGRSSGAIRDGDWKLIENFTDNSLELYNLATDPSEKVNLATQRLAKRKAMLNQLVAWREAVGATKDPPKR